VQSSDTQYGLEKLQSLTSAHDADMKESYMDTIATIQNLLMLNGSAQPVTVQLIENEKRLIAAAPELLDALRAFCGDYESLSYYEPITQLKTAYQHALTSIAKAEEIK